MDPGSSAKGREAGLAPDPPLCLPTHQVMLPVFMGELVSPETLGTTLAELDVTLQVLEDKFLQSKAFLAGPHISLADLVAITELMHVSAMGGGGGEGRWGREPWVAAQVLLTLPHLAIQLCLCVDIFCSAVASKPGRGV